MDVKEKILTKSEELFMRYGIKSITMDEVANHCNISKKTIYQMFTDKDAIITEVMRRHMENDRCSIADIHARSMSALAEIMHISEFMKRDIAEIHPSILYDLKKYHKEAWDLFSKHKNTIFYETVADNLKKGVAEGVYRENIDIGLMAKLRCLEIEAMFNMEVFPAGVRDPALMQLHFLDHFIRGVCTTDGLAQWEKISQDLFKFNR